MIAERLQGFVALLRDNDVDVSGQEFSQALSAINLLAGGAFASPTVLRSILLTTLAKKEEDEETLMRLFDLHFLSSARVDDGNLFPATKDLEDALGARGLSAADAQALADALRSQIDTIDDAVMRELARAVVEGDAWAIASALKNAADAVDLTRMQSELQIGYFFQQVLQRLGIDDVERALRSVAVAADEGAGSASGEGGAMLLRGFFDERLLNLRRAARGLLTSEQKKRNFARERILKADRDIDRAFSRLLREDLARMRPDVERLAQRLLTRTRTRERKAKRGRLDVSRMLRANVVNDSVPLHRHFKRRRRDRPELLVLCDISDSVRAASVFMLELVYAIGELFRRVRSFVFVDEIGESTELFQDLEVDDAIEAILAGAVISPFASSNYGAAFSSFARDSLDSLTRKTTVVILGDGRCNQRESGAWVVEEMRRRAKSVLWFCPEEVRTWGLGDSEMPAFERASTSVHVVRNLRQLGHAVDCVGL